VLDLKGFNLNAKLDLDPEFLSEEEHSHEHHAEHAHDDEHCDEHCTHEHGHEHAHNHHHAHHSDDIAAFVFKAHARSTPGSLTNF
jgi:ABC-type Zn2+ transport system substrate-binding protein/surface adhesin